MTVSQIAQYQQQSRINCQCQCDFVIFRRTGSVRKWRIKVCSL